MPLYDLFYDLVSSKQWRLDGDIENVSVCLLQTLTPIISWLAEQNMLKKRQDEAKTSENGEQIIWPPFGCAQHLKAGQNTQQLLVKSNF